MVLIVNEPRREIDSGERTVQAMTELLTIHEVAELTRVPVGTLRYYRVEGDKGPRAFKLGRRVVYSRDDVEAWIAAQRDAALQVAER